ncbi:MAG: hypothetical protein JW788_05585 [Candidatus Omnitrophica bacterium]|nr:hypothetical protein [Candidatus Omnitrophota bacterium]
MANSVFLAKVIGPCFFIIGLGLLFNRGFYQKLMEDFSKNTAFLYLGGFFALIFGLLIVLSHNVWRGWQVLITIFGWGGLIKGIWLIVFPDSVSGLMKIYHKNDSLLIFHAILVIIMGALLAFFGFLA